MVSLFKLNQFLIGVKMVYRMDDPLTERCTFCAAFVYFLLLFRQKMIFISLISGAVVS